MSTSFHRFFYLPHKDLPAPRCAFWFIQNSKSVFELRHSKGAFCRRHRTGMFNWIKELIVKHEQTSTIIIFFRRVVLFQHRYLNKLHTERINLIILSSILSRVPNKRDFLLISILFGNSKKRRKSKQFSILGLFITRFYSTRSIHNEIGSLGLATMAISDQCYSYTACCKSLS